MENKTAEKLKRYILKPYEIRRTMCRIRLIWLLRHEIHLNWRMARVEIQDELRVWKYQLHRLYKSMSDIYLVMGYILSDIKDTTHNLNDEE